MVFRVHSDRDALRQASLVAPHFSSRCSVPHCLLRCATRLAAGAVKRCNRHDPLLHAPRAFSKANHLTARSTPICDAGARHHPYPLRTALPDPQTILQIACPSCGLRSRGRALRPVCGGYHSPNWSNPSRARARILRPRPLVGRAPAWITVPRPPSVA